MPKFILYKVPTFIKKKGKTVPSKNGSPRTCSEIPILDMSPLVDGSNIQELAKKLGSACKDIGFFYAANHGVSNTVITNAFEA